MWSLLSCDHLCHVNCSSWNSGEQKVQGKKTKNKEQPLVMQHEKLRRHFIYFIAWCPEMGIELVPTYVWRHSWPKFHDNLFNSFMWFAGEERFSWWRSWKQRDSLIRGKIRVRLLWERWSPTGHKDRFPRRGLFLGLAMWWGQSFIWNIHTPVSQAGEDLQWSMKIPYD